MAGPWEKYAKPSGPWAKYANPQSGDEAPQPAAPVHVPPSPMGLANQALAGTGITVAPPKTNLPEPKYTPEGRFIDAAGAAGEILPEVASGVYAPPPGEPTETVDMPWGKVPVHAPSLSKDVQSVKGVVTGVRDLVVDPLKRAIVDKDLKGAAGEAIVKLPTAAAAIKGGVDVARGAAKPVANTVRPSIEKLTSTTPERIAELQSFPEKAASARDIAVATEKTAHQAAKAAFPQFNEPIQIGTKPKHVLDGQGNVVINDEPVTTTWKELQEQRSDILEKISRQKRSVNTGNTSRFDLAKLYEDLHDVDATMSRAALEQGGQEGLAQLEAARQQYAQYMNDFHNKGSAVRPLLDMKADDTAHIVNHFTSADKGARTLDVLRKYGADTQPISSMLTAGDRPLRVSANEAAKLKKAGSPEAYKRQRVNESVNQAKYNEMPSTAQARLPASAMKNKWPSVIGEIPGINKVSPRRITQWRLERAQKKLSGR